MQDKQFVNRSLFLGGPLETKAQDSFPDEPLSWHTFLKDEHGHWGSDMRLWALLSILPHGELYTVARHLERRAATAVSGWELREPLVQAASFCKSDGTPMDRLAAVWACYTTARTVLHVDVARLAMKADPTDPLWPHVVMSIAELTTAATNLVDAAISGTKRERVMADRQFTAIVEHVSRLLGLISENETIDHNRAWLTIFLAAADLRLYLTLKALALGLIVTSPAGVRLEDTGDDEEKSNPEQ